MDYRTIEGEATFTYEIKHSIFICHIKHIESYEEGLEYAKAIAKQYSDATHNCYALSMQNGQQKFFDDGEPQGTAGMPILQVIKKQDLYDVIAIVTRYFGGIKLGANGLVTSYTKAVTEAIEIANIITKKESILGQIILSYTEHQNYIRQFKDIESITMDTQYDENVTLSIAVPLTSKEKAEEIIALITSGQTKINWKETKYIKY